MISIDYIEHAFDFIITEFGYRLIKCNQQDNYKGKYFLVYQNLNTNKQIEISADESYFHCEIRRLLNGNASPFSDKENNIGFEDLAILESANKHDHFLYFIVSSGLQNVLENVIKLFRRNEVFFTNDKWINNNELNHLKNEEFEKTFGFRPYGNEKKTSYFEQLKKRASILLLEKGFTLKMDTEELPPYDKNSSTQQLLFQKRFLKIKIYQADWRDFYNIYYISINDKKIFEIDLSKTQNIDEALKLTMGALINFSSI